MWMRGDGVGVVLLERVSYHVSMKNSCPYRCVGDKKSRGGTGDKTSLGGGRHGDIMAKSTRKEGPKIA